MSLSDEQTRKTLAEINFEHRKEAMLKYYDKTMAKRKISNHAPQTMSIYEILFIDALRCLAEYHVALGEIIEKHNGCGCCDVQELVTIARKAREGK